MTEERAFDPLHPILADKLIGHDPAEGLFLDAFNNDKLHHAWLLTGPKGIGKASFAYRAAKFLLAKGNKAAGGPSLFGDDLGPENHTSLDVEPENEALQRVLAGGHGDLLTLERGEDPKTKKMRSAIIVDDVRKAHSLFHATAAEGGWRVVIVDSADELNRNAANALLKILEEPPEQAIIFLVSHAPGKLLPTIRSRCRKLAMEPLSDDNLSAALKARYEDIADADVTALVALSEGSLGKAVRLYEEDGLALYDKILSIFSHLPTIDGEDLHRTAGQMAAIKNQDKYSLFMDLLAHLLVRIIRFKAIGEMPKVARPLESEIYQQSLGHSGVEPWVELWEKMNEDRQRAAAINMDKKMMLITLFSSIGALARR